MAEKNTARQVPLAIRSETEGQLQCKQRKRCIRERCSALKTSLFADSRSSCDYSSQLLHVTGISDRPRPNALSRLLILLQIEPGSVSKAAYNTAE